MKIRVLSLLGIFVCVFTIYFGVGTQFSFRPKWAIDYFNPMAQSLMQFRLDIPNPGQTDDLIEFGGKWYTPWGILPAILLIPFQLLKGRFIPTFYLSVFFSSLTTIIVFLLLKRLQREFFHHLSTKGIYIILALFAFGTTQFYVGTLGSVWHVNQIVSSFFGALGIFAIFKKNRSPIDYFASSLCFGIGFLGRPTIIFLLSLPLSLFIFDLFQEKKLFLANILKYIKQSVIIFVLPLMFFCSVFFLYNYFRFGNIFQTGYQYISESSNLREIREKNGLSSLKNIPQNAWYLLFELPRLQIVENNILFNFNLYGNSIFFLTPPFLTIFLAPLLIKKKEVIQIDSLIASLWIGVFATIIPILMHYSSGWMQFGYRYSLDITVLLLLLSVFGIKGKLNALYVLGIILAITMYIVGIRSLM